jgi:hypothetical protein
VELRLSSPDARGSGGRVLQAKDDDATLADVPLLPGVIMELFDLPYSRVTSLGKYLDLAVQGRMTLSFCFASPLEASS